jgi:GNAT superfamily N-acetyltransferase
MALPVRRLVLTEMDAAARIHRTAFDDRLPWLAGLHTPDEDRAFYRERVFPRCEVWGAAAAGDVVGIIAFRDGWIDQFYVLPEHQGHGAGGALLAVAQAAWPVLHLYTFQRNAPARRFYERRGFVAVRESDGSTNEEREPDVLYRWERPESG